jgi:hypothetical protein
MKKNTEENKKKINEKEEITISKEAELTKPRFKEYYDWAILTDMISSNMKN